MGLRTLNGVSLQTSSLQKSSSLQRSPDLQNQASALRAAQLA
jgi:hypothetical protein